MVLRQHNTQESTVKTSCNLLSQLSNPIELRVKDAHRQHPTTFPPSTLKCRHVEVLSQRDRKSTLTRLMKPDDSIVRYMSGLDPRGIWATMATVQDWLVTCWQSVMNTLLASTGLATSTSVRLRPGFEAFVPTVSSEP